MRAACKAASFSPHPVCIVNPVEAYLPPPGKVCYKFNLLQTHRLKRREIGTLSSDACPVPSFEIAVRVYNMGLGIIR